MKSLVGLSSNEIRSLATSPESRVRAAIPQPKYFERKAAGEQNIELATESLDSESG